MHSFKVGILAATLAITPLAALAGPLEGAAIGAGTGAIVAGPPGAIVGGAVGAIVGGPNVVTRPRYHRGRHHYARANRTCWHDARGYRHCRYR